MKRHADEQYLEGPLSTGFAVVALRYLEHLFRKFTVNSIVVGRSTAFRDVAVGKRESVISWRSAIDLL